MLARLSLLPLALSCAACFQMTTVVKVNGDSSGTIEHSMVVSKQALAQLRSFGALGGGRGATVDLTSEAQARAMADTLGPGVAYISSTPIETSTGVGRQTTYAFADVSKIRISEQPSTDGLAIKSQALNATTGEITCSLTHQENGNALLTISLPELNLAGANLGDAASNRTGFAQQLAMVRALLAGAHVTIGVEPAGAIVHSSSPFVESGRVTLLDVDVDTLLGNEAVLTKLQAAKTTEDVKAALQGVPGVKLALDREVTIEFTPAK